MSIWDNRKSSQVESDKASERLDCFLSVVYLFPTCLEPNDVELLAKRDTELTNFYRYGAWAFLGLYGAASVGSCVMRGRLPFMRQVFQHTILAGTGTICSGLVIEKVAAEMYYNKLLIQMSDKYNFTQEEVMDLRRNLNQYYIKKDREADLAKN